MYFCSSGVFQSTLPHGERHKADGMGSDEERIRLTPAGYISIHAPAWGATYVDSFLKFDCHISIHAPRMGSDPKYEKLEGYPRYFNPRPPHGERPCCIIDCFFASDISIHAPRMGSDPEAQNVIADTALFQSTPPAWGATSNDTINIRVVLISIHAPRMGSDLYPSPSASLTTSISIHAPRMGSDLWKGCNQ